MMILHVSFVGGVDVGTRLVNSEMTSIALGSVQLIATLHCLVHEWIPRPDSKVLSHIIYFTLQIAPALFSLVDRYCYTSSSKCALYCDHPLHE